MTTNPLARRIPDIDPVQALHDHVGKLNSYAWIHASGKPFFVGRRQKPDGTFEHFTDRGSG